MKKTVTVFAATGVACSACVEELLRMQQFNVRVLAPTLAWGNGAASRLPAIGHDAETTPWMELQKSLRTGAS